MTYRIMIVSVVAVLAGATSVPIFDTTPDAPQFKPRAEIIEKKIEEGLKAVEEAKRIARTQCERDIAKAKAAYDAVTWNEANLDPDAAVEAWKHWSATERRCKEVF